MAVKSRTYTSERRARQAAATKRRIATKALALFKRHGYPSTAIDDIAEAARVAPATVYKAFGNKPSILRFLVETEFAGDPAGGEVMEQAWWREQLEEPNPRRQIELIARNASEIYERTGDVLEVVRHAAPSDPEIEALWRTIDRARLTRSRITAVSLAEKTDVDAKAADLLWGLTSPDMYFLFVRERRWSPAAYERWLAQALATATLKTP